MTPERLEEIRKLGHLTDEGYYLTLDERDELLSHIDTLTNTLEGYIEYGVAEYCEKLEADIDTLTEKNYNLTATVHWHEKQLAEAQGLLAGGDGWKQCAEKAMDERDRLKANERTLVSRLNRQGVLIHNCKEDIQTLEAEVEQYKLDGVSIDPNDVAMVQKNFDLTEKVQKLEAELKYAQGEYQELAPVCEHLATAVEGLEVYAVESYGEVARNALAKIKEAE